MLWQWAIHWPGLSASNSMTTVWFGRTFTVSFRGPPGSFPSRKVCPWRWIGWNIVVLFVKVRWMRWPCSISTGARSAKGFPSNDLTARKENISESIRGLDLYTQTLADAIAPGTLPDGSRYGHMKIFVDLGELLGFVCTILGPSSPGADLSAVREALAAAVPALSCPGDGGAPGSAPSPSGPGTPSAPTPAPSEPATDPTTELVSGLATPDASTDGGTVGDLLAGMLGGGG